MPQPIGLGVASQQLDMGGGLSGMGVSESQDAGNSAREAAAVQTQRDLSNARIRAQNIQGNQALGGAAGAAAGAATGAALGSSVPGLGTAIGGLLGGIIGGLSH